MKKKQFTFLLLFFYLGTTAFFTACSDDDPAEPEEEVENVVEFGDADLEAAVKETLELGADENVTEENILGLTEFTASSFGLTNLSDLTGLEHATNLELLHLGETQVTDLTPIAGLRKITYLRFNDTPLSDLSPISEYTSLTYFNANTAPNITDISPLAGNTGLKELILRSVPMGDEGMEVIRNFTSLYRLNMRNTGVTDITVLGELMAEGALLRTTPGAAEAGGDAELDMRENEIVSFDPIREYVENETIIENFSPDPLPEY